MVSGNLFHCRRNSWPPEEYIHRSTLQLVSFTTLFSPFSLFWSLCSFILTIFFSWLIQELLYVDVFSAALSEKCDLVIVVASESSNMWFLGEYLVLHKCFHDEINFYPCLCIYFWDWLTSKKEKEKWWNKSVTTPWNLNIWGWILSFMESYSFVIVHISANIYLSRECNIAAFELAWNPI